MKATVRGLVAAAVVLGLVLAGAAQGRGRGGRGRGRGGAAAPNGTDISVPQYFNQAAVAQGRQQFATHCAACHGDDARGGLSSAPNAPDLIRSKLVMDDIGGRQIAAFLKTGRPAKQMPAFPNLTPTQVTDIADFLHYNVAFAANRFVYKLPNDFTGDPAAGKAFFYGSVGKCSTCHSATGDMKGLAARDHDNVSTIQGQIVSGTAGFGFGRRGRGGAASRTSPTATVTLRSGQTFTGTPTVSDDFVVTLRLANGQSRSWPRSNGWPKVTVHDPLQAHHDLALKLTDADIHNLAAYLETLK